MTTQHSANVPGTSAERLANWVQSIDGDLTPPYRLARIGIGQSNLTYLMTDSQGHQRVLRRPPVGELLHSAHDVLREARILAALRGTGVPVPRIFGTALAGEAADAPLVLMDYIDGVVLDQLHAVERLDMRSRRAVGLGLADTLATIHEVDLTLSGLNDLASHSPYADRQLRRWSGQWDKSKTADLPELESLTARLRGRIPTPRPPTLVHGDLHLRNVIVDGVNGSVLAAIDWELSTLGDPIADLGTTLAYWPEPGEAALAEFGGATIPGFPNRAEIAERYISQSGRDVSAKELSFWHALALWKIAIIAEGIIRRASNDESNRAPAGAPDRRKVKEIVSMAHHIADVGAL